MRTQLIILFAFCSIQLWGQKDIYESVRFDELSENHTTLAIIPFFAHLDLEKELTKGEQIKLEELEGKAVQNALETYFGRGKKRKKFSVEFQNVKNTNALLAQNQINYGNIDTYTIKQLSEILEVDGIISGNLDLNVLLSRGVPDKVSFIDYLLGDANYGRIGIKISDGKTGKLLWKYENEITKKSGRNTTDLIEKMMRKMTRQFPYDKERKKVRKRS
ncbi:DUF4136 domain-containing protein [Flavobacteriaceae bacterium D16]|nr:DUF4136 domain-containing protein [Flavobacteriaceae bacterium D16]